MKIVDGKVIAETDEEKAALGATFDADTTGLKAKNAELLAKLKELKQYDGIDPDEYRTLKEQAAKADEERLKKAGEFDTLKKQLIEAHGKEKTALEARLATLTKSLEEHVLIATATQAIAAEKGIAPLLMPHVKARTRLDESGRPVVVDESGTVRIDAKGQPLTIAALVAEMKADVAVFGRAFEPSGAAGSGATGGSGGSGSGKTMTLTAFNDLNPKARAAYMASGGTLQE